MHIDCFHSGFIVKSNMGEDERPKRLLSDLSSALRRDPLIDEFEFIICPEPVCNKSPIVLEHHKLGIETWSVKMLYQFVHLQLFKVRPQSSDTKFLHECSQAAVLLNSECSTAWNIRKKLVLKKVVGAEAELKLATLVITKHPKSAETFAQRRWLLQHIFPDIKQSFHSESLNQGNCVHNNHYDNPPNGLDRLVLNGAIGNVERIVETELKTCTIAANQYPNNYNAWSHRIWVLKHLARGLDKVLKCEWTSSKDWVRRNISDHSGFHYRQYLMQSLRATGSTRPQINGSEDMTLVEEELQFTANLITLYPGHEAIWYHRRFVIHFWRSILSEKPSACNSSSSEPLSSDDITVLENLPSPRTHSTWQESLPSTSLANMSDDICCGESQEDSDQDAAKKLRLNSERENEGRRKSVAEELATITTSEIQFAEAVSKCVSAVDAETQRRCVDGYKRWLRLT